MGEIDDELSNSGNLTGADRLSGAPIHLSLFFSLPRGMTEVTGGVGRSEGDDCLGWLVSFFGFLLIFSLRCSLPMVNSSRVGLCDAGWGRKAAAQPDLTMVAGRVAKLLAAKDKVRNNGKPLVQAFLDLQNLQRNVEGAVSAV
jgi:hypothetical protein